MFEAVALKHDDVPNKRLKFADVPGIKDLGLILTSKNNTEVKFTILANALRFLLYLLCSLHITYQVAVVSMDP